VTLPARDTRVPVADLRGHQAAVPAVPAAAAVTCGGTAGRTPSPWDGMETPWGS